MPVQHLGKPISVTLGGGEVRQPKGFKLAGKEYKVKEVVSTWEDHAYSGLPQRGRGWQGGSQRQFYRLRTAEGETFEIYVETPAGRRGGAHKARWYASRRLSARAEAEPAPEPEPSAAEPEETAPPPAKAKAAGRPSRGGARAHRPRGG